MDYARSLGFAGRPYKVEAWGTPVLLRPIDGAAGAIDAMGPYPLCRLDGASDLCGGLDVLRAAGAVSVVLVSDPLGDPGPAALGRAFTTCRPFKTHYLLDRHAGPFDPSRHHRDRIRRGQRRSHARQVSLREPRWRARWAALYGELRRRKGLTGVHAFSEDTFETLSELQGDTLTTFAAEAPSGEAHAMQLWIRDGDRAYSHLTATSEAGYRSGATYVLYAAAAEHFGDCRFLDFGGGAGSVDSIDDPLATFKRGFANGAAVAHLCCSVLDPPAYAALSSGHGDGFFPRYRTPAEENPSATRAGG